MPAAPASYRAARNRASSARWLTVEADHATHRSVAKCRGSEDALRPSRQLSSSADSSDCRVNYIGVLDTDGRIVLPESGTMCGNYPVILAERKIEMSNENGYIPRNHEGVPYQGMNRLILINKAFESGYGDEHWCTYWRAIHIGYRVICGEKSTLINGPYGNKIPVFNFNQLTYSY